MRKRPRCRVCGSVAGALGTNRSAGGGGAGSPRAATRSVYPQALEPRSYVNTPVGINFLLAGYGYTQGNVAFEASHPIKDARSTSTAACLAMRGSLDLWGPVGEIRLGGVREPQSVNQILHQQRRLQPQHRQLLGDRDRLAISLAWRAVDDCRFQVSNLPTVHYRSCSRISRFGSWIL